MEDAVNAILDELTERFSSVVDDDIFHNQILPTIEGVRFNAEEILIKKRVLGC